MRPISLRLRILCTLAWFALFLVCASGFQISNNAARLSREFDDASSIARPKRELENLDESATDVFQTATPDDESDPTFWERMVKIAIKLFGKFVEWLNS